MSNLKMKMKAKPKKRDMDLDAFIRAEEEKLGIATNDKKPIKIGNKKVKNTK